MGAVSGSNSNSGRCVRCSGVISLYVLFPVGIYNRDLAEVPVYGKRPESPYDRSAREKNRWYFKILLGSAILGSKKREFV